MKPQIDYKHVLRELSVNRQDPCEVIRELISNAYDAGATKFQIFPLLQQKGFIFVDNGSGMSQTEAINDITPYEAFFSVGRSTKTFGDQIGYKCQGSKLCFACAEFALFTRCKDEKDWRFIKISNPKSSLDTDFELAPKTPPAPWDELEKLLSPADERTRPIVDLVCTSNYFNSIESGSIILVIGLEVDRFGEFFDTTSGANSYLRNYIQFTTRHGDVRVLRSEETGFDVKHQEAFSKLKGYGDSVELELWNGKASDRIAAGYPYLHKLDPSADPTKNTVTVSRLRDGRFVDRAARSFVYDSRTYSLILAIDGNRRALESYEALDRRGSRRSGIRLTDQRGTFLASQGVKICAFTDILSTLPEKYRCLAEAEALPHYLFIIDGTFELVTNRNYLSEESKRVLYSDKFRLEIEKFLDSVYNRNGVFAQLIDRLNRDRADAELEAQAQQVKRARDKVANRERFQIADVPVLKDKWFLSPETGEEHWVGALFTLFAHQVEDTAPFAKHWRRPITFSGQGIDSLATSIAERSLSAKALQMVEYKYRFSTYDRFNHPLSLTDYIVCWTLDQVKEGDQVEDEFGLFGLVKESNELAGIGYMIGDVQSRDGEAHHQSIVVVGLRALLDKTFKVSWTTPPQTSAPAAGVAKKRR